MHDFRTSNQANIVALFVETTLQSNSAMASQDQNVNVSEQISRSREN